MKYLINKMQCNIISQQVGWLDGKGVCFQFKRSIFTSRVCVVNSGNLIKYFLI